MDSLESSLSHPVIAIVLLLGILVFVHELGHFLVGRIFGISVETFSIGFGPVLFGFKKGETHYRVSAIPLGGYVKFYGSVPQEKVPEDLKGKEFHSAGLFARFATVIAGPCANFALAMACYSLMGFYGIKHPPPHVGEIVKGSPAEAAGLIFGDRVKAINGDKVTTWEELHDRVYDSPNRELVFTVERQGKELGITVIPETVEDRQIFPGEKHGRIGISPGRVPAILTVQSGSLADNAGIVTGDRLVALSVDGALRTKLEYWQELEAAWQSLLAHPAKSVTFWVVERGSEAEVQKSLTLESQKVSLAQIGISHSQLTIKSVGEFIDQGMLEAGDRILAWNGEEVENIFSYAHLVEGNVLESINLTVQRGRRVLEMGVRLKPVEVQRAEGKVTIYVLPVEFLGTMIQPEYVLEKYSIWGALAYGVRKTAEQTGLIASAIGRLFTGDMPLAALGGPISIAKVASDSVKLGWMTFMTSMALISINLGLLNLLPIPVLDGGQLVLLGIEGFRSKPLPQVAIENFQKIGFVVVLSLVVVATYNDLSRFWATMLKGVVGLLP